MKTQDLSSGDKAGERKKSLGNAGGLWEGLSWRKNGREMEKWWEKNKDISPSRSEVKAELTPGVSLLAEMVHSA